MGDKLRVYALGTILVMICLEGVLAYTGPFEFGSKVLPGDSDIGELLYSFDSVPLIMYWDVGEISGAYDPGDVVYLHVNVPTEDVDIGDVRLTKYGCYSSGSKVNSTDNDIDKALSSFPSGSGIVYTDRYGNAGYDLQDLVYFHTGIIPSYSVSKGDIRLNSFSSFAAGTRVDDNDPDRGFATEPLPYNLRFYNMNGNELLDGTPFYDGPDTIYLDISLDNTNLMGFAVVNDVRLSR
jgi:hypothetical protein